MFPMRLSPKNISFRGKATWKRMTNSIAIPMCSALKREMFTSSMSLIFIGNDGCWWVVVGYWLWVVGCRLLLYRSQYLTENHSQDDGSHDIEQQSSEHLTMTGDWDDDFSRDRMAYKHGC